MGTGRLSSFSIAGAGWMTRVDWASRAQQEWLGPTTGMVGNRRGFCRSLLLGVNGGGALGGAAARSADFIETNDGARGGRSRAAWRPLTCPALGSPLPSRFFSPLSSSLGGVSSPASSLHILLPRGGTVVRVFQDVNVAALQGAVPPSCSRFAWAGGTPRRVKRMRRRSWRGD